MKNGATVGRRDRAINASGCFYAHVKKGLNMNFLSSRTNHAAKKLDVT